MIRFGGKRVLLSTVASYWPTKTDGRGVGTKYGIDFLLRNGEIINGFGSDPDARDKLLEFLDDHFTAQYFQSDKCTVCEYKINGKCQKPSGPTADWCDGSNNYRVFIRKKDGAAAASQSVQ
ncbi:MAG: hypothetical protein R3356_01950, partial [Eudoraea sp.]|nr:hypothetical protein [Eudoraea sp.]